MALCIRPRGPALRTKRSMSRPSMRTRTPAFSAPRMQEVGTKRSERRISPVLEPRMPSLSSLREQEKLLVLASEGERMKAVMPRDPAFGSVLA